MFDSKVLRLLTLFALAIYIFGCSEDKPAPKQTTLPPTVELNKVVAKKSSKPAPIVYIEELDQSQEYFKEQHETSFSHVSKKNWTSYTAGKDGILTKVLLFGKPNYTISEHYGSSMSGFVRADNPDSGPKLGEWSITREEIINQLALQELVQTDRGWITLQMRGEIPQQAGRMYFIVCDQIGNKRSWFGAFAFAEGNSYKKGRFWLHPDHDLVFRTYVGKTADQLEKEQRGEPLFDSDTASLIPADEILEAPKPMIELSKNFEPSIVSPEALPAPDDIKTEQVEPLYQQATKEPAEESVIKPQSETVLPAEIVEEPKAQDIDPEETAPKGSLFKRFFQNKTE